MVDAELVKVRAMYRCPDCHRPLYEDMIHHCGCESAAPRTGEPPRAERLTLQQLLHWQGDTSAPMLLLLMSLLTLIPVAGAGNVMAFGMLAVAAAMCRRHGGLALPRRAAAWALPPRWTRVTLTALEWVHRRARRHLRPRWPACLHQATRFWWGAWIVVMALIIFLPIPLGNVLPSLCLIAMSLGWMFRDGLAMLVSLLLGTSALGYTIALWQATVAVLERWALW